MFPIEARFTGKGGWQGQAEKARELLTVGEIYTVSALEVGRSSSALYLVDFPDEQFNTVMFEGVLRSYDDEEDDKTEAPPADPAAVPAEIRKAAHDATTLPLARALQTSPYELIDLAVDAVYPLIAAAERQRIREMAEARKGELVLHGLLSDAVPWVMLIGLVDDIQCEAGDHVA